MSLETTGKVPMNRKESVALGSVAPNQTFTIFEATEDCNIQSISVTNATAYALDASNNIAFHVLNKGLDGTGTTIVADKATLKNTTKLTGSVISANVPLSLTLTANIFVPKGSVLTMLIEKTGTVTALAGALVTVKYKGKV